MESWRSIILAGPVEQRLRAEEVWHAESVEYVGLDFEPGPGVRPSTLKCDNNEFVKRSNDLEESVIVLYGGLDYIGRLFQHLWWSRGAYRRDATYRVVVVDEENFGGENYAKVTVRPQDLARLQYLLTDAPRNQDPSTPLKRHAASVLEVEPLILSDRFFGLSVGLGLATLLASASISVDLPKRLWEQSKEVVRGATTIPAAVDGHSMEGAIFAVIASLPVAFKKLILPLDTQAHSVPQDDLARALFSTHVGDLVSNLRVVNRWGGLLNSMASRLKRPTSALRFKGGSFGNVNAVAIDQLCHELPEMGTVYVRRGATIEFITL